MPKANIKKNHIFWMRRAILLAKCALSKGKIPSGSIVVWNNFELGSSFNYTTFNCYSTSHSEINAIKQGTFYSSNKFLKNSIIYTTLEPCVICLSSIFLFKIKCIVFGTYYNYKIKNSIKLNYKKKTTLIGGVLEKECQTLLQDFFILHRN